MPACRIPERPLDESKMTRLSNQHISQSTNCTALHATCILNCHGRDQQSQSPRKQTPAMSRRALQDISINLQSPKQHFRVHEKATNYDTSFSFGCDSCTAEAEPNATASQRRARLRQLNTYTVHARRRKRTRRTATRVIRSHTSSAQDEPGISTDISTARFSAPRRPLRSLRYPGHTTLEPYPVAPLNHDYDELWKQIREGKQHILYTEPSAEMKDDTSSITTIQTNTTTVQPDKQSRSYGEQMLHPRWIAIQEKKTNLRLAAFEEYLGIHNRSAETAETFAATTLEIIKPLLLQLDGKDQERVEDQIKYLQSSKAIEAQWENNLWRRFFFRYADLTPMHPDVPPCGHQIAQARMSFNNECALPPLLATRDSRRESRIIISETPWDPDLEKSGKDGTILWYPDYLYAVSLSSLRLDSINSLPAIRLAQHECAPAYLLIEIKSSAEKEFAAKQYMAFLGAYTLHERLLLRLAASTTVNTAMVDIASLEIDQSLSLYIMTCCGTVCKIWNMHVREMPQNSLSNNDKTSLQPIRYDLELLEEIDIQDRRKHAKLAQWINNIHYFGSTKHLDSLRIDAAEAQKLQGSNTMDWTTEYAFVYDYTNRDGDGSWRRIRPVRKAEMQKAYDREEFVPEEKVAREVVDFVEGGRMAFVKSRRGRGRVRVGNDGAGKGNAVKPRVSEHDLPLPLQSEVSETSNLFSTSSAMVVSEVEPFAGAQAQNPTLIKEEAAADEELDLVVTLSSAALRAMDLNAETKASQTLDLQPLLPVPAMLPAVPMQMPEQEPVSRSTGQVRRGKGK
jgi:hypothetical protein